MKVKQINKFLNKMVVYKTIWNTFETAKLINVENYHAVFEKQNNRIYIKTFNISEIKEVT